LKSVGDEVLSAIHGKMQAALLMWIGNGGTVGFFGRAHPAVRSPVE